jgi:hypothetical protein
MRTGFTRNSGPIKQNRRPSLIWTLHRACTWSTVNQHNPVCGPWWNKCSHGAKHTKRNKKREGAQYYLLPSPSSSLKLPDNQPNNGENGKLRRKGQSSFNSAQTSSNRYQVTSLNPLIRVLWHCSEIRKKKKRRRRGWNPMTYYPKHKIENIEWFLTPLRSSQLRQFMKMAAIWGRSDNPLVGGHGSRGPCHEEGGFLSVLNGLKGSDGTL